MNSLSVWLAFVLVAIVLGLIAYFFSLRVLRWSAAIVALVTAAYLTRYGLTHPANAPSSLSDAFTRGADALIRAFFHLPPVPGHHVPGSGWIGLLVIAVLLVIGYRELEALSQHRHARCVDTSELTRARQTDPSGDGQGDLTDVQRRDRLAADLKGALNDAQRRDRLAAELKFWLPAVEVHAPAILPGGSRSNALASIAEASGVNGSGLAGAIIRFFGILWPSPRRVRVRVWMEGADRPTKIDAPTRVTVSLDDPGTGASIGTKTLAAGSLDHAACAAAGYVARRIFAGDPTVPPWSIGTADGGDLAAMLLVRQVRVYPESEQEVTSARCRKIGFLELVADGSQCAGVARYELAHLHDLNGDHVKALKLHANNQEQHPRFYRGRYRLAMSLEMIASSDPCTAMNEEEGATLDAVLKILHRWDGTTADKSEKYRPKDGKLVLCAPLRSYLLKAAWKELQEIRQYLTLRDVIWHSFWHRKERRVLKPYWRPRHRQSFHDGVFLAQLLVAVRQALSDKKAHPLPHGPAKLLVAVSQTLKAKPLPHPQKVLRIATAIAGDSSSIAELLGIPYWGPKWAGQKDPTTTDKQSGQKDPPTMAKRLRTRHWPMRCSTPSWPAAYNLACAYAAIYADRNHHPDAGQTENQLKCLVEKVVTSLEFAINNPECEMERPSEWIESDPDFGCLRSHSTDFTDFLADLKQRDYPPVSTTQHYAVAVQT